MLGFRKEGFEEGIKLAERVINESEFIHPKCKTVVIKELKEVINLVKELK